MMELLIGSAIVVAICVIFMKDRIEGDQLHREEIAGIKKDCAHEIAKRDRAHARRVKHLKRLILNATADWEERIIYNLKVTNYMDEKNVLHIIPMPPDADEDWVVKVLSSLKTGVSCRISVTAHSLGQEASIEPTAPDFPDTMREGDDLYWKAARLLSEKNMVYQELCDKILTLRKNMEEDEEK